MEKIDFKEEYLNFICGGKTGDFIHCMLVVKLMCEKENKKANLYLSNGYGGDTFHFSIEKTYDDLKNLIFSQEYVHSFEILDKDISNLNPINLNIFRSSNLLYKDCWINILTSIWGLEFKKGSWLKFTKDDTYKDKIVIHRSTQRHISMSVHGDEFPWDSITKNNECLFITNLESVREFENFPFRDRVKLHICNSFSEMVKIINSCKFFIGNMSTPLALAHCLQVPHLGELVPLDDIHYINDEMYINNFFYIKSQKSTQPGPNKLNGIENFLNL